MADARSLRLEADGYSNVSVIHNDNYKLGEDALKQFTQELPHLATLNYWSPEYQAWWPLVQRYLTSSVSPELAEEWLLEFNAKVSTFTVPTSKNARIYAAIRSMYSHPDIEAFKDIYWQEICDFYQLIPRYIDNQKVIFGYLYSAENYIELITSLMNAPDNKYFAEALYLYRHCVLKANPTPKDLVQRLQQCADDWADRYSKEFCRVQSILPDTTGMYMWYTDEIKELVCRVWHTALDLSSSRKIIDVCDVMKMPVWLSESVTSYLNNLPCTFTLSMNSVSVFNALEYAFLPNASLSDPQMIYPFCIVRSYINSMFKTLGDFYWLCQSGELIPTLISCANVGYINSPENSKSPSVYLDDLRRRGFPMEGFQ